MATPEQFLQSIKIDGNWRTQGKGPHDDPEVRAAYSLHHAETLVAFLSGMQLTQFRVTKRTADYLVMLKGTRAGKKYVAFLNAPSFMEALILAATYLDSGYLSWAIEVPWAKRKR